MEYLQELLKTETKDNVAFNKLQIKYREHVRDKESYRLRLHVLEQAIQQDYDSIMIVTTATAVSDPVIVYVNDAFSEMTGYRKEEVYGMSPFLLHGPETSQEVMKRQYERVRNGLSFAGETIHYRKDGSAFHIRWDMHPLRNDEGVITHWVSYQNDITARHTEPDVDTGGKAGEKKNARESISLHNRIRSLSELQITALTHAISCKTDPPSHSN